nr:MAG TPA: hypothetical protein [Caudoviricetes sp.]
MFSAVAVREDSPGTPPARLTKDTRFDSSSGDNVYCKPYKKLRRYESNSNNKTDRAPGERIGRSTIFRQVPDALSYVYLAVYRPSLWHGTASSSQRLPMAQQSSQLHRRGRPRNYDGLAVPRLWRGGNVRGNGNLYQVVTIASL